MLQLVSRHITSLRCSGKVCKRCVAGGVLLGVSVWVVVVLLQWRHHHSVERQHLYRDLYYQESWPGTEREVALAPNQVRLCFSVCVCVCVCV
jgi:hypothetical protein